MQPSYACRLSTNGEQVGSPVPHLADVSELALCHASNVREAAYKYRTVSDQTNINKNSTVISRNRK